MNKNTMDKLLDYLQTTVYYHESDLILLLSNSKIMITEKHIANIKYTTFNILKIFETYGYIFSDDDYLMLVKKCGYFIQWIPENKKTREMCEIAHASTTYSMFQYIPKHLRTLEMLEIRPIYLNKSYQFIKK